MYLTIGKQQGIKKSHSPNHWKQTEQRLQAERERLMSALAVDSTPPDDLVDGWQERDSASEREAREIEYTHRGALRQQILRIDQALERIKAGTYGLCDRCQERINRRRLAHSPDVALCLACQKSLEGEIVPSTM